MTRFHELDALRTVAMLLGIVLHACLFFFPEAPKEQYETEKSNVYVILLFYIHGFRMPLFFLLSGFFTAMLWQQRGLRELGKHRLKRIGLPLAIGAVTIIPINALVFSKGDFNLLHWPVVWLAGFQHLWFLWMMLFLAAAFMLAARLGLKFGHWAWWLLIPLTVLPYFFMQEEVFGPDTSEGLIPDPNVLGLYALFFVFGAFFYQRKITMRRWWAWALPPTLTVVFVAGLAFLYPKGEPSEPGGAAWAVASVLQAAYAWLMCFGTIGLFRWIASKERPWVRYMSDSSYWLYLWHLPLMAAIQILASDLGINAHLNFLLLCLLTTGILLAVYQFGVRYTWIGTMLNGKRARVRSAPAGGQPVPGTG